MVTMVGESESKDWSKLCETSWEGKLKNKTVFVKKICKG